MFSEFYKKIKFGLFIKEAAIFVAIDIIGIFSVLRLNKILAGLPQASFEISKPTFNDLLFVIVFTFLFFYALFKSSRFGGYFLKIFYIISVFGGIQLVLSLFTNNILATVISAALVSLSIVFRSILFHNLNFALAICGISLTLGARIDPIAAVIILVIFSLYDIVAVYLTGHMVKMAKSMIEQQVIFAFVVPSKTSYLIKPPEEFKIGTKENDVFVLGGGDIALPLVLIFSLVKIGITSVIAVSLFTLLGIFLTHLIFVLQSERKPMAALPPIATLSILGYLIALFLKI